MIYKKSLVLLSLFIVVSLLGCAARRDQPRAAQPGSHAAQKTTSAPGDAQGTPDEPLPLDPMITLGRLDNGLTYFIRTNQRPEQRAEIWLVVNAGSMQEDEDQQGLAHFVEHMAFNGTQHFAKQELVDYLESIGMRFGPDLNAYTSFDETVYKLKVPTDDEEIVNKAFLILEDWAHGISFEGEEIDKERGVVLEERRLGRGANARMRDEQLPILFKDSRYAERLPIGQEEILESAPHDVLRRFYRDWYRPDLMAVLAVGDFDPDRIEGLIKKHFSRLRNPGKPRPRELFPVPDHDETLFAIATDPEATYTSVGVYYKLPKSPDGTEPAYRRQLVESLYHSMTNARLDEIRQQPDPPFLFAFSGSGSFVRSKDVYSQSVRVEEGGIERGLEALLVEVARVDRYGFTQTELDRAKKEMLRGYEKAYAERDKARSSARIRELVRVFLTDEQAPGIEYELELAKRFVPDITLEELNGLARQWISESNRVVMISAPEKEDQAPPAEEALLAMFAGVADREIEPYVDQVRDEPLVQTEPRPGRIVEATYIEEIDVTHWRLSNGIEVVLKPTDFKNDEVLLTAFSPGGNSLVSDEQHTSAVYSGSVLGVGGLGEFSQIELEKALAGKIASAYSYIGELEEGLGANASPEDLEVMFQLLYLNVVAPRKDPEAFSSWLDRTRGFIANRLARPETVFRDEMMVTTAQGHVRRRPTSPELLDEIDLDDALAIHEDRFADVGDFTFVIVGNFDPEAIQPFVLTWIGGLPAAGREETWRDVGVRRPDGVVKFEVEKGLEPKSAVTIAFSGDAEWSRENQQMIGSLASVLRIRLREILREDKGATYGVSVAGSISRRPIEQYSLNVSFRCGPENVEELIGAVFEEVEAIKQDGIDESYVQKVRESQTRSRETNLKENGFWRGVLGNYYRYEMDPRLILAFDELIEIVTQESVQAAANRYLNTERYVQGVLNPEPAPASE